MSEAILWPRPRRPMVGLALAFIAGILAAAYFPSVWPLWCLPVAFVLCMAAWLFRRARVAPACLLAAMAIAGWMRASMAFVDPSAEWIGWQVGAARQFVTSDGVIVDAPTVQDGDRVVFPLSVAGVLNVGGWRRSHGTIEVRLATGGDRVPPLEYGDRLTVAGMLTSFRDSASLPPRLVLAARVESLHRFGHEPPSRFYAWCLRQRVRASAALGLGLDDPAFSDSLALMRGLVLGERANLPDRANDAFARTGTLHIIAISGSHVAIILFLLVVALKALGLTRTAWLWAAAPVLIVYTAATGLAASAVRSCAMALSFLAAPAAGRRPDGPSALALAALLILVVDPGQLWNAGFMLSFVAVGGIMTLYRPVEALLERVTPGAVDPARLQVGWGIRFRAWLRHGAIGLLATSLSAWLVTAPLTAFYFNMLSPIALAANLIVVPLAFVVLLAGCLALIASAFSPLLVEIFNHAGRTFVDWMMSAVGFFDKVPGACCYVVAPSIPWVIAFEMAVLVAATGTRRTRWYAGWAAMLLFAGIVILRTAFAVPQMSIFGVGRSSCAVLLSPGRGGDVLLEPAGWSDARAFLRSVHACGTDRLAAVVLLRNTPSSSNRLAALSGHLPVDEVWSAASGSLDGLGPVHPITRGDAGALPHGVSWEVLYAGGEPGLARDRGMIIRFTIARRSIVVTSAVSISAIERLSASRGDLRCDTLVLANAPETIEATDRLLSAFRPRKVYAASRESDDGSDPVAVACKAMRAEFIQVKGVAPIAID